ncbi:MAG: hypothetical protein U9Q72_00625 [Patescibacteria group bacterium]|nr:hypothetical protein [Patescibacteria group bacterium]
MNELITVSSNLEAFYAFLKWLSGGLGFFGLSWLLLGLARYAMSAGDAEKKKESIHILTSSAIVIIISVLIGGTVFWLGHL